MSGRQGFITNHQTYIFQESPSTGPSDLCSAAFGLDNSSTRIWRLLVKNDDSAYIFTSGQFTIDPSTNGNITFVPNGSGNVTISNGGLTVTAGGLTVTAGTTTLTPIATATYSGLATVSTTGALGSLVNSHTDGQVLISSAAGTNAWASLTAGSNITITPGTNSISIAAAIMDMTWTSPTTSPIAVAINNGYVQAIAGSGLLTFTLPQTAPVGSVVEVLGQGSGGWLITPYSGQTIRYGNVTGSTSIGSTNQYDCVKLVCRVANTTWVVTSAIGVLNVV